MAEDIEQKVIEIVSEQMGVDKSEITRETHFINDLNADSLDSSKPSAGSKLTMSSSDLPCSAGSFSTKPFNAVT